MKNTMLEHKFFNALKIILKDNIDKLWPVMENYKTFENIYENLDNIIHQQKITINRDYKTLDVNKEFVILIKNNVSIALYNDDDYPHQLKQIYRPPLGIYIEGNITAFNNNRNLAVIGSRKATNYGKMVTEKIIKELSVYDIQIVSGLAVGIDTCAHT